MTMDTRLVSALVLNSKVRPLNKAAPGSQQHRIRVSDNKGVIAR